jgi:hypothetical protein
VKFDEEISYERTNKSYMLAIASMATVRNFGVILDNFNAVRICMSGNFTQKLTMSSYNYWFVVLHVTSTCSLKCLEKSRFFNALYDTVCSSEFIVSKDRMVNK